ncbi:MAG: ABC transporter permease [Oligoflexia bacterium]|nr:ABC transporter permease [Oligoflexia bacterium]
MRRITVSLLFFLVLLGGWEALVRFEIIDEFLFPAPTQILSYLIGALKDRSLIFASGITLKRLMMGYAVGLICGLPLGMLCARFKALDDTLGLLALGFQTLPSVCWVPLALLWFGQSEGAMLFVVIMGCLWSVLLAAKHGVEHVPPLFHRVASTMGSSGLHQALFVTLPAALPGILGGMKQGWAFAWRSLMAAEIYVTILTGFGLGHLLHYGRELHAMDQVFGVMLVIMLCGYLVDRVVFSPAERYLHRRWGTAA